MSVERDAPSAAALATHAGLSDTQANILRYALRRYQWVETHGNESSRRQAAMWGIPWCPWRKDDRPNGSDRASVSRALRRLESRGLVQRRNDYRGDRWQESPDDNGVRFRTLQVKLTAEGRKVAERLTIEHAGIVNRPSTGNHRQQAVNTATDA